MNFLINHFSFIMLIDSNSIIAFRNLLFMEYLQIMIKIIILCINFYKIYHFEPINKF